jgi:glycosyltransferase involved in cell wall biosynthesis
MVLGIRGLLNVQGGVETHAQQLYPRLAALGCEIEAIVRTPFSSAQISSVGAIRIRRLWSPRRAGLEAMVHSLLGVLYAAIRRPDVLHIHSIGPAIVTPLARLFGLRVVVTFHSQNYQHEKWSRPARWILLWGESLGARFANARIVISRTLLEVIRSRYGRDAVLIPNGVGGAEKTAGHKEVLRHGAQPGRYLLHVGRVALEKRQLDLIRAYSGAALDGWRLMLVGEAGTDDYAAQVRREATAADVIMTGYLSGEPLAEMYTCAAAFVLPSSHEGMPIALLEALSFGLPVVVSDIAAHRELKLPEQCYFRVGDLDELRAALESLRARPRNRQEDDALARRIVAEHDWDDVAKRTLHVYRSVL